MSLSSSSSPSVSHLPRHLFSSNSSPSLPVSLDFCFKSRTGVFVFTAYSVSNLLLLPVFILVLCVALQRWRKQPRVAMATMSHSDFLTYNMIALELLGILGNSFTYFGAYADLGSLMTLGSYTSTVTSLGQTLFHILTCAERYLAVIHPITYLGLRQVGRVRIRNIVTGCIWLLCFGCLTLTQELLVPFSSISAVCFMACSTAVVSFCSISVVCVLIHPRPGDGGSKRVDHLKQRAVNTIVAILGVLLLRFLGVLICTVMYSLSVEQAERCVLLMSSVWFSLPSSLLLPLLFLHRVGKLPGCSRCAAQTE